MIKTDYSEIVIKTNKINYIREYEVYNFYTHTPVHTEGEFYSQYNTHCQPYSPA